MKTLPQKTKLRISALCYAVVSHAFAEFINEKNRGPNFNWENFPDRMKFWCREQVYLANIGNNKNKKDCYKHAEETGEEIAKNLIKWAGFVDEK